MNTQPTSQEMAATAALLPAIERFRAARRALNANLDEAEQRFAKLFSCLSKTDRMEAAEAMPAYMRQLLIGFDDFIASVALEAADWIGGVLSPYERKAVAGVASAGWDLESYNADFEAAAEKLRAAIGAVDHFAEIDG